MDVIILPEIDGFQIGDKTSFDGKEYIAEEHFNQGYQAKQSNYTHFMFTARGVFGMREV